MSRVMLASRSACIAGAIVVAAAFSQLAPAQQAPGDAVYRVDFTNGLPDKWEKGKLVTEGLPADSKGAVTAAAGQDIQANIAWVDGHFTVEKGLYLNFRAMCTQPQWYQLFVFCKARGAEAKDMTLYEAKPPVDAAKAGEWQVVSVPLDDFKGTQGPNQGKPPQPDEVCWTYFWSFQGRDLGMVIDRIWVTRGKPGDAAIPQAEAALPPWAAKTWAFDPPRDTFDPAAMFNLRGLNEKVAGESGFMRLAPDGNSFVLGDGKPVRLWALNTSAFNKHPLFPAPDLARHARFLAKRGVNMVRFHGNVTPTDGVLNHIDTAERDNLWRLVAAMKKEGIYTTFSPYWAVSSRVKHEMGVSAAGKGGNFGLLFFDPRLQDAYKQWMKQVLTVPNPQTGIPLAQDPALAIIQLQNEDSLLFWTAQNIEGEAAALLRHKFGDFVIKKYGSFEAAKQAWPDATIKEDDPAKGEMGFYITWELTQDRGGPGQKQRCADQMQFTTQTMADFNRMMADYLHKDLGCKQLVNAGNWRTADETRMLDAERYSYCANDVLAVNRYYTAVHDGANAGWAIVNGDTFTDDSVLLRPRDLPVSIKQVDGHPMLVTESSWVPPLSYQSEGPFLVAAYQSLNGLGAYYWFATGEEDWRQPGSANGYMPSEGKWVCATPMLMGQWPAAALMYRMGYVRKGQPAVFERRALEDLWSRRTPIIAEDPGFDPNRDSGNIAPKSSIKGGVDPLAFLVGPVVARYGEDPSKSTVAKLSDYIGPADKRVHSITNELAWDYGNGICTLNAPCAQGATGFLGKAGAVRLADTDILSQSNYATVLIVSLDGQPLAAAARVLVQVGTRERPTGWKTRPTQIKAGDALRAGEKVVSFGTAPWQIAVADITLRIANPKLRTAHVLDVNGMPTSTVPLKDETGRKTFRFPENALYVVLD
jgi:prepilin-type processing-associated H-X9-DG protein